MVNSVSNVPSGNYQPKAMDKVSQEQLYNPGLYATQELLESPHYREKKGSFLGFLGKLVLTAAVIGGVALGARKLIPSLNKDAINVADGIKKDAGFGAKVKYYVAKLGDFVDEKIVTKIKNIFSKKAEGNAAEAAEDVKK